MKFKFAAIGLALVASAISAQATSLLTWDASRLSYSGSGAFFPVEAGGHHTDTVQDQIGWTASGTAEWGAVQTLTEKGFIGEPVTSANGALAQVATPGHLIVSTQEKGGFAQAEQDITLQLLLSAHSTGTVSWSISLAGSNFGLSSGTFAAYGTFTLGDVVQTYSFNQDFAGTAASGSGFGGSPMARSISFTNTSDSDMLTTFHSNVRISTLDVIPAPAAVPEADTAWMALAGMAAAGAVMRRRRG
ncbi:MAG: PEP-CTERM sorting domain-containing protein [Acidobacteriota bacterium]